MLFHQFSTLGGLRPLVCGFNMRRRLSQLGCATISRSTLAESNATVFSELFTALLRRARPRRAIKTRECVHPIGCTMLLLNGSAACGRASRPTCGSLRLRLLKTDALVRVSARRIEVAMASAHPWQDEFGLAYARLRYAAA